MARAENQGLQIALILFVMLTIVLGVMTFLYFRSYDEERTKNAGLVTEAQKATKLAADTLNDVNTLKGYMGYAPETSMEQLKTSQEEDMKLYAATLPAADQHYHQALLAIHNSMVEANEARAVVDAKFASLEQEHRNREKAKQPIIDTHAKSADAANAHAAELEAQFNADRAKLKNEAQTLADAKVAKETEMAQLDEKSRVVQQELQTTVKKLDQTNIVLADKIEQLQKPTFEVADGTVQSVNPFNQTVYINLGKSDNLPRLTNFSVHDFQANTKEGKGLKGSIEVLQVIDDHMSLCRILDEDPTKQMVPGDKIYTPLWNSGQKLRFAVLGKIDLNKDGIDDRPLVRDLVGQMGGQIDAEVDNQGKITGALTIDTRYIIIGDLTEDKLAREGAQKILGEAKTLGVEAIPAIKFFELSGWKDPRQSITFGKGGNAGKVLPDEKDGGRTVAAPIDSANFKLRRPWAAKQTEEKEDAYSIKPLGRSGSK
jgi:hypothetical protein